MEKRQRAFNEMREMGMSEAEAEEYIDRYYPKDIGKCESSVKIPLGQINENDAKLPLQQACSPQKETWLRIIKGNLKIAKARQLAIKNFGIDPCKPVYRHGNGVVSEWRQLIRIMIQEQILKDHEIAVVISTPYASRINEFNKTHVSDTINFWASLNIIRSSIKEDFLRELGKGIGQA